MLKTHILNNKPSKAMPKLGSARQVGRNSHLPTTQIRSWRENNKS